MNESVEESFRDDGNQKRHYVIDRDTGDQIDLSQEGNVHGFTSGQRVRCTEACHELLRGREGTIFGFSEGITWTQLDGYDGLISTWNEFVPIHLAATIDSAEL